jgi:dipeptidyl aminopeptidase/acylaminoacyl peptidase
MDLRSPGSGIVSPDGKKLYFTWTVTGTPQVWRLDGPGRFPIQLTGGNDLTSVVDVSPDGATLIVARDRNGEENPGLYLMSPEGGALQVVHHVAGVQTNYGGLSSDGKYMYFASNDRRKDAYALYRYDLATKAKELLFDEPGLYGIADRRADGRLLVTKALGSDQVEVFEWRPATRKLEPLFGQGEREEYQVRYGAKDDEVVVRTNKGSEYRRLYVWKAGTLQPLGEDVKADVEAFDVDDRKQRVVYTLNERGYSRLAAVNLVTRKPVSLGDLPRVALKSADLTFIGSQSRDGRFLTLSVDDGQSPPRSYVFDWTTGKTAAWHGPSAPELDTRTFTKAALETYKAQDGTAIPAFVRRSAACEMQACPVIVQFHGGPEGQARPGFNPIAQVFVDAGFVWVEPNVRGSDGYGKAWLHADDGPKRLNVIGDIRDAATWARERFAVGGKPPKVGVAGGSYGGYATLMAMTYFAGSYDAGVAVVGMSSLLTFLENTAPYRRILRISEYGDPTKDREALTKLSPITHVDKVNAPLLLIQGATDPRVPVGESLQMYEHVKGKGVSSGLIVFADEGHGARKRDNRVLERGHMLAFFEQHLKSKAAEPPLGTVPDAQMEHRRKAGGM